MPKHSKNKKNLRKALGRKAIYSGRNAYSGRNDCRNLRRVSGSIQKHILFFQVHNKPRLKLPALLIVPASPPASHNYT